MRRVRSLEGAGIPVHGRRQSQQGSLGRGLHWRRVASIGVAAVLVMLAVVVFGRDLNSDLAAMERWIAARGVLAPVIFIAMIGILAALFVPESLLSIAAGALFGLAEGTIIAVAGNVLAGTLLYLSGRHFLRAPVRRFVDRRPTLTAVDRAVQREGVRMQLLLRLTPISPAALSLVFGAAAVPYRSFLVACVGLVPSLFFEVYIGYAARHVSDMTDRGGAPVVVRDLLVLGGLVAVVVVIVLVTRIAQRAIHQAEIASEDGA